MLQYGIIKHRKDLETEMLLNENGGPGDESTPISGNQMVGGNGNGGGVGQHKKMHHQMEEKSNVFVSIASGWGKGSADEQYAQQRSSLRSINNSNKNVNFFNV